MTELRATARLQLHADFDLVDAAAQVPYYAALGISHYYLSPIATSRAGSTHGYDVTNPQEVNPELGGEEALRALADLLHQHDMGMIVDIVPNHMAADMANAWWRDVHAHGQQSPFADYFDIDWDAPETTGRLWLPILGQPLGVAIKAGDIGITLDTDDGRPGVAVAGRVLPMSEDSLQTLAGIVDLTDARGPLVLSQAQLTQLLDQQHYRLAHWRSGNDIVNYRRFFDITELVALAVERRHVFDAVHTLPLRLIAEGLVDGLRIDHVDGLSQPRAYLRRLRRAMDRAAAHRPADRPGPISLHVEKILATGETLPPDWPVDGTTGYDFMDQVSGVLHDERGAQALRDAWHHVSGRPAGFEAEEILARGEMVNTSLQSEFATCVRAFLALARREPESADLTEHVLARSMRQVLQWLRVYRTYLGDCSASPVDRQVLERAFAGAETHGNPDRQDARAFLRRSLLERSPRHTPPGPQRRELQLARRRFEQLAAPLNAKSVEDTGFYRSGALLSRNEVGSDPRELALGPALFHQANAERARHWPRSLLALATHDHKRGPDARARLAVLSQRSEAFSRQANQWVAQLRDHDRTPSGGDGWMLLQTVLAAWPLGLDHDDADGMRAFADRLAAWQTKALREAKLATRWTAPNEGYESACAALLHEMMLGKALQSLRQELAEAAHALDAPGALNGLAMTTLQLTAPGIPDIYQGNDRWDESLVDPDNRRPVDYPQRLAALDESPDIDTLLRHYSDGRIKQWLTLRLLHHRRDHPRSMLQGTYTPLEVVGEAASRVLAFMRSSENAGTTVVIVPRLCADWLETSSAPRVAPERWAGTWVRWPDGVSSHARDVLAERTLKAVHGQLELTQALSAWPVAVLFAS